MSKTDGTEDGMSAGSGDGGFSTAGTSPNSSSASEPPPPEPLDPDLDPGGFSSGPIPLPINDRDLAALGQLVESVTHVVAGPNEASHFFGTGGATPIFIVPTKALLRYLAQDENPDTAAVETEGEGIKE